MSTAGPAAMVATLRPAAPLHPPPSQAFRMPLRGLFLRFSPAVKPPHGLGRGMVDPLPTLRVPSCRRVTENAARGIKVPCPVDRPVVDRYSWPSAHPCRENAPLCSSVSRFRATKFQIVRAINQTQGQVYSICPVFLAPRAPGPPRNHPSCPFATPAPDNPDCSGLIPARCRFTR
jgi:hypothetical protein